MRNRFLTILAALAMVAALFAFGCKKEEGTGTTTASTDTTANSTTSVSNTDTSGTTSTNPATSDTTGTGATTGATSSLNKDDSDFVMKAAQGGLAEVASGNDAASRATNADVKNFGQRMVTDHSKANDELKQLASTKGVTLPTDTDDKDKKAMQALQSKSGAAYDKAYMSDMVKDHDKDVKEFEEESKKAKDPDLKAWVDKTLPTLKEHQKMAHDIARKLK